jgi:2,4-dienoyl-CoA reductase-like NADH-dependent reductase (Old Yellow Enzyme family)
MTSGPFSPFQLGNLNLPNRFIKTATSEGMSPGGLPSPRLLEWHRKMAAGGVAMTTLAYCAPSFEGRTFPDQLVMREEIIPFLEKFTRAIHAEGAAASIQLSHCGYFSKMRSPDGKAPRGPSRTFNAYGTFQGIPFSPAMTSGDIRKTIRDFAAAAYQAKSSGFDAIELHAGHGYLLSQFLSPTINRRRDGYGGPLQNRARLSLEIVREMKKKLGPDFPVLVKINMNDGFPGGLEEEEAIAFGKLLEQEGVQALILSGGYTSRTPFYLLRGGRPLLDMVRAEKNVFQKLGMLAFGPFLVRKYPFRPAFFRKQALRFRKALTLPLVYVGGLLGREEIERVSRDGFELLALGRALIHDPDFVRKLKAGALERSGCTSCNRCITEMDRRGVRCVLNGDV